MCLQTWSYQILHFSLTQLKRLSSLNLCIRNFFVPQISNYILLALFRETFSVFLGGRVNIRSWHSVLQHERDAELCGGIRFTQIKRGNCLLFIWIHLSPVWLSLRLGTVWGLWWSVMELIKLWLLHCSWLAWAVLVTAVKSPECCINLY